MDWDDFKFVQAIAQTGSVRGAGELLRVHGSTVARRLEQLEQRIGTRLFTRTSAGMDITPAGSEVIDALNRVARDLDSVERRLSDRRSNAIGTVVLAAPPGLIGTLLIPHLTALFDQHPEIELRLMDVPVLEKLHGGEADAALWITDDPPADLIGRSLGTVMACVYLREGPVPDAEPGPGSAVPADTAWIGAAEPASRSAEVHARYFPDLVSSLQLDADDLRALAVQAGLGAALLPCYLGDSTPGIRRAGGVEPLPQGDMWLLMRPDSRGAMKVRLLTVYLQELFESHRARLSGTSVTHETES